MARGLGKGLGALFGDDVVSNVTTSTAPVKEENKDYKFVDIKKIKPNPKQARKRFDETEIEELAQSIKVHGVIQPILLTAQGNGYTIIAGERRFKAAIKAGLNEIPAIVLSVGHDDAPLINIFFYHVRDIIHVAVDEP